MDPTDPIEHFKQHGYAIVRGFYSRPEPLEDVYGEYAAPLRAAGYDVDFVFVVAPWHRSLAEPLAGLIGRSMPA